MMHSAESNTCTRELFVLVALARRRFVCVVAGEKWEAWQLLGLHVVVESMIHFTVPHMVIACDFLASAQLYQWLEGRVLAVL
jgi:hypothetical protein